MNRLRTLIIGMGERGIVHLHGFLENADDFEVVGLYNRTPGRAEEALQNYHVPGAAIYHDLDVALEHCRPDVVAVCLPPSLRLEIVKKAAEYGVKYITMEKPMATSLKEAKAIVDVCDNNQIKLVVCQQHKCLRNFLLLRETLDAGELGDIMEIRATCRPWSSQLGTHYIDYMMWANGYSRPVSVVAHIHGNKCLDDSHPSPDYLLGQIAFENGVRGIIECGYFSKTHARYEQNDVKGGNTIDFWTDDRLTIIGTKGYAYAELNGKFVKLTEATAGKQVMTDFHDFVKKEQYIAQVVYTKDMGDWILGRRNQNDSELHNAYMGYEALEAMYLSGIDRTRVDLPVASTDRDAVQEMKQVLKAVDYIQV